MTTGSSKPIKTMADLANLAGVSVSTVSRALSGHVSIPEITQRKIQKLARKHHYRINTRAQNLRLQRSNTIAVVFPQAQGSRRLTSDPFYLQIMGGISDELRTHGYDLLLSLSQEDDWRYTIQSYVLDKRADGLLVLERDTNEQVITALEQAAIPFVVWGPVLPEQSYISVGGDSYGGAKMAVEHLLNSGRRHIGFIGGDQTMIETHLRYRAYCDALKEADRALDATKITFTDYTPERAKAAVTAMLKAAPKLDALFCCSDVMALAAFDPLRQAGRDVPEDVAVIGYDDIPLAAHCHPSLSTVRQEVYEGGRVMVQTLLQLLQGEGATSQMLPVQLMRRDSCP
ncbi:MAG: LacI family DNA-binding transcriptional regulator [Deinococcota bacterium]